VIKAVKGNAGLNRHLMDNGVDLSRMSWNMSQSSARYRELIANCATCRQIEDVEYFLFIDVPLQFTGGGLAPLFFKSAAKGTVTLAAKHAVKQAVKNPNLTAREAYRLAVTESPWSSCINAR
ncbi:MAG: hypothetical protein RR370_04230, partial [Synergistaceae bacterium]